jgi:hypothetical protein
MAQFGERAMISGCEATSLWGDSANYPASLGFGRCNRKSDGDL